MGALADKERSAAAKACGLALAAGGAALGLALVAFPVAEALPAQLFLAAVMLSAAAGGTGPALLTTAIGAASLDYFFEEPYGSWVIASGSTLARQVMFVAVAVFIGVLSGRLRRATRDLARANEALRHLALLDDLTGLGNRRALNEFLEREWRRAARDGAPMSLVMLDIDHFKALNDRLGHAAGDAALRRVGEVVATAAGRAGDLAARYGGEEFAVVLGGTPLEGAVGVGERLRQEVERLELRLSEAETVTRLTVSIGVATSRPGTGPRGEVAEKTWKSRAGGSPDALLAAADAALYEAKRSGRNRLVAKG